jgi:hypothetical protein
VSSLSRLVLQPALEEPDMGLQESKDNESDRENMNDIVTFDLVVEPDTLLKYEYRLKNALLHTGEMARQPDNARRMNY